MVDGGTPVETQTSNRIVALTTALEAADLGKVGRWGRELAGQLTRGGRVLVVGNGGSAAQAQHLAAELVGRFERERHPLSAIALTSDAAVLTAVGNDYGFDEVFARQVRAHARPGDVLVALSTSGRSTNVLAAIAAAQELGITTWAFTGPAGCPLSQMCDDAVSVEAAATSTIQECHLLLAHELCAAIDNAVVNGGVDESSAGLDDVRAPDDVVVQPPARRERNRAVVVVGDVLADCDWVGSVGRVSPEAPVPVLGELVRQWRPGGAGMAAMLAAADGWEVSLVAAWPADDAAARIRADLTAAGVRLLDLATTGPMPTKIRMRARGQTLLMVDDTTTPAPISVPGANIAAALNNADGVLVADYGRGVAAIPQLRTLLGKLDGRVPLVWDPHPRGPAPIEHVTVCVPNSTEAALFDNGNGNDDDDRDAAIRHGRHLRALWRCQNVVVKRGAEGAVLLGSDAAAAQIVPAPRRENGDTCGAGDRFAVSLLGSLLRQRLVSTAVQDAVVGAADFVAGHRTPRPDRLRPRTTDALAFADRVRAGGGTVVATGGCFDVLHEGHRRLLESARAIGDCLIVLVNSDASVSRLKGPTRPLVPVEQRAAMLEAFSCVDAVVVFDETTPESALAVLRPDLWVKGGDYNLADLPERAVVEQYGGQVVTGPYLDGVSTSELIARAAAGRAVQS